MSEDVSGRHRQISSEFETGAPPDLVLEVGLEAHERHVVIVEHFRFTGLPGQMISEGLNKLVRAFPKTTTRGKPNCREGRPSVCVCFLFSVDRANRLANENTQVGVCVYVCFLFIGVSRVCVCVRVCNLNLHRPR